ncbi:hypothetical protein [Nocardioides sp.]|uniref:hypothetical protein n=1 Tax=Nocardioides sp. TaxID=35761 RepID=UPI002611303C|nr:hypothetical protein [Nocardioides sp.]
MSSALAAAVITAVPGGMAAHGIGGARDLPIPRELAIAGAVAALVLSFSVLALAWRTPRYDGPANAARGRPAPLLLSAVVASTTWKVLWRVVGFAIFAYTVMVAVFGKDLLTNPFFGIYYIWWWVGLVPLSLFFGPVWKAISPVRTINAGLSKLTGNDPEHGLYRYPEWLGHWPAALGLFAFVWMELVYPNSTELGPVRLWCAVYVAVMLVGGALWGNVFYARADPFEVYSSLVAKLSIWGRHDGRLWLRSPLANLATVVPRPGLVAVAAVLFGSTGFDSFKDSPTWVKFFQSNDFINAHSWAPTLVNFAGLLGMCVLVGLIFVGATMATGVGPERSRRSLPATFAHSILPIIVAYVVAHYLTYLLEGGKATLIKVSDPFSDGSNWFGTGDWSVSYWFAYHPTLLAVIKVSAVVIGHVLGVIAAHDRSIAVLPKRHQLTGQLPLLFAMVAFTAGGLYLLFSS